MNASSCSQPLVDPEAAAIADQLIAALADIGPCVVAFSGGVDSSVVAAAAFAALRERSLAVTAAGAAVSRIDREYADAVAAQIGIRHRWIDTAEIDDPEYTRNDSRRCYHCKRTLYSRLQEVCQAEAVPQIVSGTNADDLHDYRPGLQAAAEHGVRAPLAELGIAKQTVRRIAAYWRLSVADRPAAPCLASRLAYGVTVTRERLDRIERAESLLHAMGFRECRVRQHEGDLARVEISAPDLPRFASEVDFTAFARDLTAIGFRYVTLDLSGFRSGSLNPAAIRQLPVLP